MTINAISSIQLQDKQHTKTENASKENEQELLFQTEPEQTEDLSNKLFQEPKEKEEPQGFWANIGSGLKSIDKYTFDILKYNEIGSRFYRLYTESLNHPEDAKLKSDLLKAQKEFEILDKQKENKALDYIFDFKIPYLSGLSGDAIYSTISNKEEN